jgi:outer membrane protein OmpA-like peptidoglycan-associated protein
LGGIIGCSSLEVREIPITANPSTEISNLEVQRAEAQRQQVDVLSPKYYAQAEKSLRQAEKSRAKDADTKEILKYVAVGLANLDKANTVARISRNTMPAVIKAREDAVAANAEKILEKDFKATDQLLIAASSDIEDNKLDKAEKSRDKLSKSYGDLELQAIQKDSLGAAIATIEQAVKEGGRESAGRTFAIANQSVIDARAYIIANHHNKKEIQNYSDRAAANANRLLSITRQVKVTEKSDPESVVLNSELQRNRLRAAAEGQARKQTELVEMETNTDILARENRKLEVEKSGSERLDAAKKEFSSDEADVYRDGDKLVIRMKSLAFPSGSATLAPENFALLAKVQKVIEELGDSHITVEGHTDTVGKPQKNQKLSNERARAIGGYFAANGVDSSDISTVGYGDSKPIAPNKSKEGRAQNRRVDVIVAPKSAN